MRFFTLLTTFAVCVLANNRRSEREIRKYNDKDLLSVLTLLQATSVGLFSERFDPLTVQDFEQAGYGAAVYNQLKRAQAINVEQYKYLADTLVKKGGTVPPIEDYELGSGNAFQFLSAWSTNSRVGAGVFVEASALAECTELRIALASMAAVNGRMAAHVRMILGLPAYTTAFETPLPFDGVYTLTRNFVPVILPEVERLPVQRLEFLYNGCEALEIPGTQSIVFTSAAVNASQEQQFPLFAVTFNGLNEVVTPLTVADYQATLDHLPEGFTGQGNVALATAGRRGQGVRLLTETANVEVRDNGDIRTDFCIGEAAREGRQI